MRMPRRGQCRERERGRHSSKVFIICFHSPKALYLSPDSCARPLLPGDSKRRQDLVKDLIQNMKKLGFWIPAMAFLALTCSISTSESSFALGELVRLVPLGAVKAKLCDKKPKLSQNTISEFSTTSTMGGLNSYNLEDYPGNDPSPSSKVDVHSKPIEHGTPLNPFVPGPAPPTPRLGYSP